jgi:hypothetical protein
MVNMNKRTAYLLTLDFESERAVFSKGVLDKLGFDVILIKAIPNQNKIVSQKHSFQYIYRLIMNSESEYSYVFEDDVNVHEGITLDEIIEYEKISDLFFYVGICEWGCPATNTGIKIQNHDVYSKSGWVRGTHAMGFSRKGAEAVLNFSREFSDDLEPEDGGVIDVILEKFTYTHPTNVCRYELEHTPGHRGMLFQDRNRFPVSTLWT